MNVRPPTWPVVSLGDVAVIERSSIRAGDIASGTIFVGLENIERGGAFGELFDGAVRKLDCDGIGH